MASSISAALKTLSPAEVESFITHGYLLVREAFARELVPAVLDLVWPAAPIDPQDRATWTRQHYVIQQSFHSEAIEGLYTARVLGTFDDLLGAGRSTRHKGTGYMLLNLPGFVGPPWTPPTKGWHIDGTHFHHHVNSREQGLIGLYLYTDIAPGGGGTVVRPGSHRITARILEDAEPEGLAIAELSHRVAAQVEHLPVVEVVGNAGDMVVMHPHLYHGSSDNCSDRIRIASNLCVGLHESMNLHREDPAAYSPVERAIVQALAEMS